MIVMAASLNLPVTAEFDIWSMTANEAGRF